MAQEVVVAPEGDLPLSGQTVVISGTLPGMSREEATQLIQRNGGKVTGSVSKKTTFLLAGENAGQQADQSRVFGDPRSHPGDSPGTPKANGNRLNAKERVPRQAPSLFVFLSQIFQISIIQNS